MPQFYTDPSITTRGMREPESISEILMRFAQLQQMADQRRYGRLREEEANLNLTELRRTAQERGAMRTAFAAGAQPGFEPSTGQMQDVPGLEGLGAAPMAPRAPRTSQSAILSKLQEISPHQVPELEQQFATQEAAQQKQRVEFANAIANLDQTQLENTGKRLDIMGSMAGMALQDPQAYPGVRAAAIQQGFIKPEDWPEQFSPELVPRLEAIANQSKEMRQAIETKRHNLETEKRKPIPGVDVPLSPEVEAQRKRIAAKERSGGLPLARSKAQITNKKSTLLQRLMTERQQRTLTNPMAEDEFRGRWQAVQDDFEAQLEQIDPESPVEHLEITADMVAEHFGTGKTTTAEGQLPARALAQLKVEGEEVQFNNGQVWKLEKGKPVRVR
jgi:hypothetical protein